MIDHLVLATPHLAATAEALRADWGAALEIGGAHTGLGTCNRLTGLGDAAYLEVIGPDPEQPQPAAPRPFGVDDLTTPALVAWCARPTRPLADVIAECDRVGVHLGPPVPMSRLRPDGVQLDWLLTLPVVGPPRHGTVPFLIDWLASPHPATTLPTDCTLESLVITTPGAERLRAVLDAIGHDSRIVVADGSAGLTATLRTPAGVRRLSS